MYRIALIEKPVGTICVFTFLHRLKEATITDFIGSGWNRRTTKQSLDKLLKLGLVDRMETSRFPRFEKKYRLTPSGVYVSKFVGMVKEACDKHERFSLEKVSRSPKGCMRLLVHFSREGWEGISDLTKKTQLSANQAYKCLRALENVGVLAMKRRKRGRAEILSCKLTSDGSRTSLCFDALESTLDRALRGQETA